MLEVIKAQFYHSVRIEGKECQTVVAGKDGISKDLKMKFEDNLIIIDSPKEPNLIIVGMTNTRHFQIKRTKSNSFVFSRENSIPPLVEIEDIDVSNLSHEPIDATDEVMDRVASMENHDKPKENLSKKKAKKAK